MMLLTLLDTQVVRLQVRIDGEDTTDFETVQVWRSKLGEGGPYERITSAGYGPAFLPIDYTVEQEDLLGDGALRNIQGDTLSFVVNDTTHLSYTFPGSNPLNYASCANFLNAAFPGIVQAGVLEGGRFFLKTVTVGGLASLKVLPSDAAVKLGLLTDTTVYGLELDIRLIDGQTSYAFTDYQGKGEYFYKTRFSVVSEIYAGEFAAPVRADLQPLATDPNELITGYVKVVDLAGFIVEGQEVVVFSTFQGTKKGDLVVHGGEKRVYTDRKGYASLPLLRGTKIDVSLPGTSLMQRVNVPTDASLSRFDLLDPLYADKDSFAVQRLNQPFAERRNL